MNATTITLPSKSENVTKSPNWFVRVKSGAGGGSLYSVPNIFEFSLPPTHPEEIKIIIRNIDKIGFLFN